MGKTSDNLLDKLRSVARHHRYTSNEPSAGTTNRGAILPVTEPTSISTNVANPGGSKQSDGPLGPVTDPEKHQFGDHHNQDGGNIQSGEPSPHNIAWAASNETDDATTSNTNATAPRSNKSEAEGSGDSAMTLEDGTVTSSKPSIGNRFRAGCKRFVGHVRTAVCASYINVLLIFVPIGIAAEAAHLNPSIIFALNAVAIVPLAGLLAHATETVAAQLGSNIGALLNVTFGNAVELIIFIIALAKNEIPIVQASLIGSILANLLLILGMAFLFGGLRFREQIYNNTVTQMSACLLTLSVASLVLPTAFHASFNQDSSADANFKILEVSRGTSVILLLVYILYLLFQLKSHAYMYEGTPQNVIDEESHPGVLADMLNSSSSSSDTDSDGDSSSDSSASHGTAGKRLRRLIKSRRRRKSSASTSTAGTVSMPSISSPSENRDNFFESRSQHNSRSTSPLGVIVSGDEAEADGEHAGPRIRDFVSLDSDAFRSHGKKRRHRRHQHRHRKHRHRDAEKAESPKDGSPSPANENVAHVGFSDNVEAIEPTEQTAAAPKRPFNMRAISSRATTLRPGLSKMLSNNVFVTPPPAQHPAVMRAKTDTGLRRTSSLPDRLNKQGPPIEHNQLANRSSLPPYTIKRSSTPRLRVAAEGAREAVELDGKPALSRTAAIVMLLVSTALVAVCAEFMVDAIPEMIADSPVSEAFIGLIILPIVGNAAEHVTAVTVAAKNKMDLAIGVAVGSSIQIALFVTPIVVLLGWIMDKAMSLYFNIFQTVGLFITVLVVNFLCLDGRSNYLEGALLIAAYVIIALVAFYYPDTDAQSSLGGGYSP